MYVNRTYHYPAQGKTRELGAALQERAQKAREQGIRHNLLRQVVLPNGPTFLAITAHESAEALEKYLDAQASDQELQDSLASKPNLFLRKSFSAAVAAQRGIWTCRESLIPWFLMELGTGKA